MGCSLRAAALRVICLAALLAAVPAGAGEHVDAAGRARPQQDAADQKPGQTVPDGAPGVVDADKGPAAKVYEPECDKPRDHDEADLCVQREAVKASREAVFWAKRQSEVGLIGILGVVISLGLSAWAAFEGRKSANIARRAFTEVQRAWLYVSPGGLTIGGGDGGEAVVTFTLHNHGTMPATINWLVCEMEFRARPAVGDRLSGPPLPIGHDSVIASGGQSEAFKRRANLPDGWRAQIEERTRFLYLWGGVQYEASPAATGHTQFCFVYDAGRGGFVPAGSERNKRR